MPTAACRALRSPRRSIPIPVQTPTPGSPEYPQRSGSSRSPPFPCLSFPATAGPGRRLRGEEAGKDGREGAAVPSPGGGGGGSSGGALLLEEPSRAPAPLPPSRSRAGRGEAAAAGPPCPAAEPVRPVAVPPPPAAEKMRSKGRKESLSDSRDLDGSYDQLTGECRPRGRCSSRSGSPPPRPRPRPASSPGPGPRRPASPAERRSVVAAPAPGGHRSPGRLAAQWETTLILPAGAGAFESLPATPQPASRIAAQDSGVSRQPPGSGVPREPGHPEAPEAPDLLPS